MNLITLDEYKESKGLSGVKEDSRIQALIDSVSPLVKAYCANSFIDYYTQPKIETFTVQWSTNALMLTESPIVEIVSVEEREGLSESYKALSNTEYYVDDNTDSIFRSGGQASFRHWSKGPGSVRVTYKAGYSETPPALKLAIFDLVTYYYKDEYKARKTLSGASVENITTSSQNMNVGFPDHIKRVLDLYKNVL